MDFTYPAAADRLRYEVRDWLLAHLQPEFEGLGHVLHAPPDVWSTLTRWERTLGAGGWIGLSWPKSYGGRDVTVLEELVFAEEYIRSGAPFRAGFVGENLLGPTLLAAGSDEQRHRFLPGILAGSEYWCQGFSEPGAGSDLAAITTRAVLDGERWRIDGQKVWTGHAQYSDWIFALCRTDPESTGRNGLSLLLVPMRQPGIEVRPIVEMTGNDYFCEVFLDGAETEAGLVVGAPGDGWRVAMGTLGIERGTAFLTQQIRFARQFDDVVRLARSNDALDRPDVRQRLAAAFTGFEIMRYSGYRTITSVLRGSRPGPEGSIGKLHWSHWHQELGELAMEIAGAEGLVDHGADSDLHQLQQSFLFSRADTIYAGSSQIQRTIVGERVLGLPREG